MDLDRLGMMLDCSRNGVLTVASVKQYMDILAKLGYNCLMLYTEDTYEVENQPYFGYLRGRYSQAELKELDAYAAGKGIELIPCIQTLAHLNAIVRWKEYKPFTDVNDILLCDDERTYALVEDMFGTLEKCFTSRIVNIGMDEAHMVGLGKYLDQHGYEDRFKILTRHLNKVCEIAQKHGFHPIMWSDMFFRLGNGGVYTKANPNVPGPDVVSAVPKCVDLVYWNYYSETAELYDGMMKAHRCFDNTLWFAGGFWNWTGFSPKNAMSIRRTALALDAAQKNGIRNVLFTTWGDDGQECSHFAVLPSVYYAAQIAKGITDPEQIKAGFREEFGMDMDDFMLLDLPGGAPWADGTPGNPDKYLFYNDPFLGFFDTAMPETPHYDACVQKLEALGDHPQFGYLFRMGAKLCRFLQLKATIGLRTRKAYQDKDRAALETVTADYGQLLVLLEEFYLALQERWMRENKPFGFDVQDIRIGGLKQRIAHCRQRLQAYLAGETLVIEELEEQILPEFDPKIRHNHWGSQVTAGSLTMAYVAK